MRFAYLDVPYAHPIVPLRGRRSRPRTVIPVRLEGPAGTLPLDAFLDTGADDTVFPDRVAAALGIDLSAAGIGLSRGVGGQQIAIRYTTVKIRLTDYHETRDWEAIVGFAPLGNSLPMLGFAGCLEYFTATFHGDREEVELTVTPLYPGT